MDLLIGFFLFDAVLYLLLRLLAKPRRAAGHAAHHPSEPAGRPQRTGPTHPLTVASAAFAHRGMFIRPLTWPRTRPRIQDPPPRW